MRRVEFMKRDECWSITAPASFIRFVRFLPELLPEGSVLYLEDSIVPKEIKRGLDALASDVHFRIRGGNLLPTPFCYHIGVTTHAMERLADLTALLPIDGPPGHVHAYCGKTRKMLLQWYDANAGDPIYISREVPEERIKRFCHAVGCAYEDASSSLDS